MFEDDKLKLMQCINCGYTSTDKFLGTREDNEEYQKLSEDMKSWSIENDGRIWIPAMMTLPMGMLYPVDGKDGVMQWGYAKMVDIPEEEQKNYPIPNQEGMFYKKIYDNNNAKIYNMFVEAMSDVNEEMKKQQSQSSQSREIKLPKLKKIDGK